jgi:predicted GIY-YIG superfamily endonuclease
MGCKRLIIYIVQNQQNGCRYVGATTRSLGERKLDHLERAARGQNGKLYEAIRAFSSGAFI